MNIVIKKESYKINADGKCNECECRKKFNIDCIPNKIYFCKAFGELLNYSQLTECKNFLNNKRNF